MKEFLSLVGEMMRQWDIKREYCTDTVLGMVSAYGKLSNQEKEKSLSLLDELLQVDYHSYFFIMSTLLVELKEEEVAFYIEKMLGCDKVPLWKRIRVMYQLRRTLFSNSIIKDEWREFQNQKMIYNRILQDIEIDIQADYSYIPWEDREKKIVIVVNQILNELHAPTRKMVSIYKYFKKLGYNVVLYVCFYSGNDMKSHFWYDGFVFYNQIPLTGPFSFNIDNGEKVLGYNLILQPENYLQEIKKTMNLIYDEHSQFVFELGDRTILAGLCQSFTTVVTMGCTKQVPVTNASVIARYFEYSPEEEKIYQRYIETMQTVIDVKHVENDLFCSDKDESKREKRKELGIEEETFVMVIAGNRLDWELTDEFLKILSQVLKQNKKFKILLIGKLNQKSKEKIANVICLEQTYFLGFRKDFQKVISAGDLFLNPPRQGGGTGAAYAGLEGLPVITLDHCDVAATVGEEFVCQFIDEMPFLVQKYYKDKKFYNKQKEIIKKRIQKLLKIDSLENFKKLCSLVKEVTLNKEKAYEE